LKAWRVKDKAHLTRPIGKCKETETENETQAKKKM